MLMRSILDMNVKTIHLRLQLNHLGANELGLIALRRLRASSNMGADYCYQYITGQWDISAVNQQSGTLAELRLRCKHELGEKVIKCLLSVKMNHRYWYFFEQLYFPLKKNTPRVIICVIAGFLVKAELNIICQSQPKTQKFWFTLWLCYWHYWLRSGEVLNFGLKVPSSPTLRIGVWAYTGSVDCLNVSLKLQLLSYLFVCDSMCWQIGW